VSENAKSQAEVPPQSPTANVELFCPFPSVVNPHAEAVHRQSLDWARRFRLLDAERDYQHLGGSKIGWLVARAFHNASQEELQIAADWTTLFCLIDDRTEESGLSPVGLSALFSRLLEAFRTGHARLDDDPFALALVDLRRRMDALASPEWVQGFGERVEEIFTGFAWEAINRAKQLKPEIGNYRVMRETTVGLYPQFEFSTMRDVKLPPEVLNHPIVRRLQASTSKCVGWANDIFTYEKELAQGEVHNIVAALMSSESLPLEEAVQRACEEHDREVHAFIEAEQKLPSFGAADDDVQRYVVMLRSWIRGHLDWSVETGRYRPQAAP
jgi:Terpene synthase family 2, C-terminal metal binding